MQNIKKEIHNHLIKDLELKIDTLQKSIKDTVDARNNDTKSSAGDKYETGREMLQIEIQKNEIQLSKTLKTLQELSKINLLKTNDTVEYGSLVITNNGNYFIAIAYGKIEIENNIFYSISLASPIGKLLLNKKIKEHFTFQEKEYTILDIV